MKVSAEKITLSDIISSGIEEYQRKHRLSSEHKKAVWHIINCRTSMMGRHEVQCTGKDCNYRVIEYNSCRDRHCNKCDKSKKLNWIMARSKELLPISYFHVVSTLPQKVCNLAICNKEVVYDIFFKSVFYVINLFAEDKKYLGGKIGFFSILHTWGQTLSYHPHLHIIVTAGGLRGKEFVRLPYQDKFLFPVKAMSMKIREKFVELLQSAYESKRLSFPGKLESISQKQAFTEYLKEIGQEKWVVYSKPPFSRPEKVLEYFSRYTHRVAISNSRILSFENGIVTISYKDYKDCDEKGIPKIKTMSFNTEKFIQRFLWHVLPNGFKKIRYGGLFSSGKKRESIRNIRDNFEDKLKEIENKIELWYVKLSKYVEHICPACERGKLIFKYALLNDTS